MSRVETLTLSSLASLVNINGLYILAYGWIFGMSVWLTFFGGVIAFRTLPRQQFSALQHRIFPVYFIFSLVLSTCLLGIWVVKHPDVLANMSRPYIADVAQLYTLASVIVFQSSNYFVVGPLVSKTMHERQKLEKEEGKVYSDPTVSNEMKALTRKFMQLHGLSSLANLFAVVSLVFHGLWIGDRGIKGY